MNIWILNAIIIEGMALLGIVAVFLTRRTSTAFAVGFNTMLPVTLVYILYSPPFNVRKIAVLTMVIIYLAHMNWLLLFKGRHTAIHKLDRSLPLTQKLILPLVITNTAGWGYTLPFYFAARRIDSPGIGDFLAIGIYIIGTIIHFGSDYQKIKFKERPESRHKLITTGFWSLCRHPNYFGDFLIYVSFALIGGNFWGWLSPALNFLQYRFDAIPKNEKWASEHYGSQWQKYKQHTKMFIPFIY